MTIRLRKTSHTVMRTGLVMATAGALLFSANVAPAFAVENSTAASPAVTVPVPPNANNNPNAAQNVKITVEGKLIQVSWERPLAFRGEYQVQLKRGAKVIDQKNTIPTSVAFDPSRVEAGQQYYIVIKAYAANGWETDESSLVISDNFRISSDTPPAPPAPPAPGEGSDTGNGSGSDTDTPAVQPPAAPTNVKGILAKGDSTGIYTYWFPQEGPGNNITSYEIKLVGSNDTTKLETLVMKASDTLEEMTFTGLTPGVSYQIQVRAQNSGGWSDWSALSEPVTIPADQDAFKMKVDESGFGVFVHPNGHIATVSWTPTGYEPKGSAYYIRISCVSSCAHDFKKRLEQYDAHGKATNWKMDNLPAGYYKAEIRLVNGKNYSNVVSSDVFKIGTPVDVANPKLVVSPTTDIDPAKENTLTVKGTGYLGEGNAEGVYVMLLDRNDWTPGTTPLKLSRVQPAFAHVPVSSLDNGTFTVNLNVAEGKLSADKKYAVVTMAAHALSISDRSLDQSVPVYLKGQKPEAEAPQVDPEMPQSGNTNPKVDPEKPQSGNTNPKVDPEKPQSGNTNPKVDPEKPQSGNTNPKVDPEKPQSGNTNPKVDPEKPQSGNTNPKVDPEKPQSGNTNPKVDPEKPQSGKSDTPTPSVTPVAKDGKPAKANFVQGEAVTVEFTFAHAPEGSVWSVALHSDPISLGEVTVKNGHAVLKISAETAAKFITGAHTLKFTQVGVSNPQVISLPWTVTAPEKTVPAPKLNPKNVTKEHEQANTGKTSDSAKVAKDSTQVKDAKSGKLASTGADAAAVALLSLTMLVSGVTVRRYRKMNG